jgi:hypothetical protein
MTTYKFNEVAISNAVDAAKKSHEQNQLKSTSADANIGKETNLQVSAECISITTEDHKVCINLPLGFGNFCFGIPVSIPDGTVGQACLSICTTWGIPTGIKVTIEIGGITIVSQSFGKC